MSIPSSSRFFLSGVIISAVCLTLVCGGCDRKSPQGTDQKETETVQAGDADAIADKTLADFQGKLLEEAIDAATLIPVEPHRKDRSKIQQQVVEACLQLGQPVRAVRYSDKIQNWRRGYCYAKTAYYLAGQGYSIQQLQKGLDVAEMIAKMDHRQKWRRDRIRSEMAKAYFLAGEPEKARAIKMQLEDAESTNTTETEIKANPQLSFEDHVRMLRQVIDLDSFEITIKALHGYAVLYDQHYQDVEKRHHVKTTIDEVWEKKKLPVNIRIELLLKLSGIAIAHGDFENALSLINENQTFIEKYQWPIDKRIPLLADLAKLRYEAGDTETANSAVDALLVLYNEKADVIWDIYRAEILCPVAEAYQLMERPEKALAVYKEAVEGAIKNPNLMPRGEDLSAIYCSMALCGVEPDDELWQRIQNIRDELNASPENSQ